MNMNKVISLEERRLNKGVKGWVKFNHGGETPFPLAEQIKIADVDREGAAIHLEQLARKIRSGSVDTLMVFFQQGAPDCEAKPHAILMDRQSQAFESLLADHVWNLAQAIHDEEPYFMMRKKT